MTQVNLFEPIPLERFEQLSREEMIHWMKVQKKVNDELLKAVNCISGLREELETRTLIVEDQCIVLRNKIFGKSSEREKVETPTVSTPSRPKDPRVQLPSERYPGLPKIERDVDFKSPPDCKCCGAKLKDSGMTETTEFLTVVPKQYFVVVQKRHKYRCEKCHGDIQTAPNPSRIKEGSAYDDDMMIDVVASKYCDLIPVQRYVRMAERSGVPNLPQQSLIEATHYTADYLRTTYELIKREISKEKVLHADETPHRMLEGDDKENWYLWGFSSKTAAYFEAHDTRSGNVASQFLKDMSCEYLITDVYSGYGKAVRQANELRQLLKLPFIYNAYCNAHARRRFKEAHDRFPLESQFFIDEYMHIYRLEAEAVDKPPEEILALRKQMVSHFDEMKNKAIELTPQYSTKSSIGKAIGYLLGNFKELTRFLENPSIPIDNNSQERLLRNPVIGRKTWYGTHSKRGAETMAILFSLIESCKLNKINPREYLKTLVQDLHQGKTPYTPATFKAN